MMKMKNIEPKYINVKAREYLEIGMCPNCFGNTRFERKCKYCQFEVTDEYLQRVDDWWLGKNNSLEL